MQLCMGPAANSTAAQAAGLRQPAVLPAARAPRGALAWPGGKLNTAGRPSERAGSALGSTEVPR